MSESFPIELITKYKKFNHLIDVLLKKEKYHRETLKDELNKAEFKEIEYFQSFINKNRYKESLFGGYLNGYYKMITNDIFLKRKLNVEEFYDGHEYFEKVALYNDGYPIKYLTKKSFYDKEYKKEINIEDITEYEDEYIYLLIASEKNKSIQDEFYPEINLDNNWSIVFGRIIRENMLSEIGWFDKYDYDLITGFRYLFAKKKWIYIKDYKTIYTANKLF